VADVRITSGSQAGSLQALTPAQPAGRAEAVKAAQRAFFNAALVQAQAPSPVKSAVAAAPQPQPQTTRLHATLVQEAAASDRILRPGSLLDIRV
jgi:hypothetical protein